MGTPSCDGTGKGKDCKFPFIYKGKLYTGCTSADHNQPWCATDTHSDGTYSTWGNCNCQAYPIGDVGSLACVPGSIPINSESACRDAAKSMGKVFEMTGSWSNAPPGCVHQSNSWSDDGQMYYNHQSTGSASVTTSV